MGSIFNNLPQEVQQLVFGNLTCLSERRARLKEYVLVSNDWKSFLQPQLYKLLNFSSVSQFTKYYKAVEKNQNLFSLTVDMSFDFNTDYENFEVDSDGEDIAGSKAEDIADFDVDSAVANLLSHSLKLERVKGHGPFFKILANALQLGYLPLLKFIEPPNCSSKIGDYIECVMIIKERLHNLMIMESFDEDNGNPSPIPFNRLFDNLNQFKRLVIVHIKKESDNIVDLVEKITRDLPNLCELKLDVEPRNDQTRVVDINGNVKPQFVPANNVRNIYFTQNILHDSQLVLYTIHKFPKVLSLRIDGLPGQVFPLNESVLNKFLQYLSNINLINIQSVPFVERSTVEYIGTIWKNVSRFRVLSIEFMYEDRLELMNELSISMEYGPAFFKFSLSGSELKHTSIVRKHGYYIESLTLFGIGMFVSQQLDPYNTLFFHPLQSCTNLKRLNIRSSVISGLSMCNSELTTKRSLDFLNIIGCTIEDNECFRKLSTIISFVNILRISDIAHVNNHTTRSIPIMHINMSETDIGNITLSSKSATLMKVTIGSKDPYYKYLKKFSTASIEEQEFYNNNRLEECVRICVSCKSLNILQQY